MRKLSLFVASAATLLSASAFAADLRMNKAAPAMMAAPFTNWSGFYIGGHLGYGWADADYRFATAGQYNLLPGDAFAHSLDGFMGGGHVGINWQMGTFVLGLEGSWTWTDARGSAVSPFFPATDTFSSQIDWVSTITPRLGFTNGPMMFYVKGGVAFAEIGTSITDGVNVDRRSDTAVGWTIGGGIEWMFTPNWILGVEANYYDFGRCCDGLRESSVIATGLPAGVFSDHRTHVDMFSVLGRISYKFGDFGGGPVQSRY